MAKSFELKTELADIERLVEKLGSLGESDLGEIAKQAVNDVSERTYDLAKRRMNQGLSLSDAYISSRTNLKLAASANRPRAVLGAAGAVTTLGHYASKQLVQPTRTKRVKGDPIRGIPKGQKQDGISVEVRRGNRKIVREGMNDVFTLVKSGKQVLDSEGNPLIVRRIGNGKGKMYPLYGPSVYQLFKYQVDKMFDDVSDDLEDTIIKAAEAAIEDAFK